jgi:hypothetical protein
MEMEEVEYLVQSQRVSQEVLRRFEKEVKVAKQVEVIENHI